MLNPDDFPYLVAEDDEIIARFKRLEDAAQFASNREWQEIHHVVTLSKAEPQ